MTHVYPVGTVRRSVTNWGFAHVIKLDQGGAEKNWMIIDAYGPMELVTDAEVTRWPVVYIPADDKEWAASHGLNPNPNPATCNGPDSEIVSWGLLDEEDV